MSYALPSMTRVPAAEKGLTIADFLVPVRVGERVSPRMRNMALVVAGSLLIYLTAKVAVPIPGNPVPITLQNFGVLVVGGSLGLRRGGLAAFLYVALGVVGLPFFAEHKGGISVILGTHRRLHRRLRARRRARRAARGARLGPQDRRRDRRDGARDADDLRHRRAVARGHDRDCRSPWAIELGMLPFLVVDTIKLVAAAAVFPVAWWVVGRRPSDR